MTDTASTAVGHALEVRGLCGGVDGTDILRGVDLRVSAGEVHVVMGPNGSGKSTLAHVLMGRPGYEATAGTATLDGTDLLALPAHERAAAGLFLVMQHPTEVPAVSLVGALQLAADHRGGDHDSVGPSSGSTPNGGIAQLVVKEAAAIGLSEALLHRPLNVDASGGERKRTETCQLAVLNPSIAILDELDSGLDIDALAACANRVEQMTNQGLGVLAITHFPRVLKHLAADAVHVMIEGQIVASGGSELAAELEQSGYTPYLPEQPAEPEVAVSIAGLGGGLGGARPGDAELGL